MVARVRTVAFLGVEVGDIETQVTIAAGLPAFTIVGLPDKAVAECASACVPPSPRSVSRCRRAA